MTTTRSVNEDSLRKRLAWTIAEWRTMGDEQIAANTAADVIDRDLRDSRHEVAKQDLPTPVVTPPFERMHAASPREIERALRLGGWDSGPIDAQSVIVAAVNGVLALRRSDPTQADATPSPAAALSPPEGENSHLVTVPRMRVDTVACPECNGVGGSPVSADHNGEVTYGSCDLCGDLGFLDAAGVKALHARIPSPDVRASSSPEGKA